MDIEAELARLKSLFDKGLIDEAEYREEKKALLSSSRPSGSTPPQLSGSPQGTALSLVEGMTIGPDNNRLFRLEKKLGGGAMGEVWKAEDVAESKIVGHIVWVAVKALIPFLSAGERHREALKREAINAKKLSHAHIIRTHDWYEDKVGGFPFLVMEYLEGQTLDQKLAKAGHFTYAKTLDILKPIVEALTYAWEEHHIVHRDLKPDNIYLTADGKLKLLDFGIAAQVRNTASAVGLAGFDSPGTIGYAPPEAGSNRKADPRFDIYALGVLTYELLEGKLPFNGLRQPTTLLPEKPEQLNEAQWQVLQKAMDFEVEKRYSSVKEFWRALQGTNGPSAEEIERQKQEDAQEKEEETKHRDAIYIADVRQADEAHTTEVARKEKQETESQNARESSAVEAARQESQRQQSAPKVSPEMTPVKGGKKFSMGLVIGIVVIVTGGFVVMVGSGKQEAAPAVVSPPTSTLVANDSAAPTSVASPQTSSYRPGQAFKDCPECPEMVVIPSGNFMMGWPWPEKYINVNSGGNAALSHEVPQHGVSVRSFALAKTEVTQKQWRAIMGTNPSHFSECGEDCPVEQVSWDDAQAYVLKLSAKTGKMYRLPSEAEFEYAARAGTSTHFPLGECIDASQANFDGSVDMIGCNKERTNRQKTVKVGSFAANGFGLYDMIGNVNEWVEDCWHENYYHGAPTDGSAWVSSCEHDYRVMRNGSWKDYEFYIRLFSRTATTPSDRKNDTGFRPARVLP